MKDVGTLSELGLKVGDTYTSNSSFDTTYTVEGIIPDGFIIGWDGDDPVTNYMAYFRNEKHIYRIKTRANQPKLWRDMTAEEKGALLLAAHEGNVIEAHCDKKGWVTIYPSWYSDLAYRIKPEPKVETVTNTEMYITARGCIASNAQLDGAKPIKLTYTKTDGVINLDSYKLEYR